MYTDEILSKIKNLQSSYLPSWKPDNDDAGWAVARTFAHFLNVLEEQRDKLPKKLFIAYLDSLGFSQNPPLAAKTPATFLLTKNFKGSALIPKGTLLETKSKVNFETTASIMASSTKLVTLVDYDSTKNQTYINDHATSLASNESFTLFNTTKDDYYIYFGDDSLFNIHKTPLTTLNLIFTVPNILGKWEYFGQKNEDEASQWYAFNTKPSAKSTSLTLDKDYSTIKQKINAIESYWIRVKVTNNDTLTPNTEIAFSSSSQIDALYYNDRPLSIANATIYPFGKAPQKNDSFYIGAREAFSKRGHSISISPSDTTLNTDRFSWEYWNGKSWKYLSGNNNNSVYSFTCPYDIAPNKVNGEENFWIRVRLLNIKYTCKTKDGTTTLQPDITAIQLTSITISVTQNPKKPQHIYEFKDNKYYKYPLTCSDKKTKSLYFAFDKPFGSGLFSMYIDIVEREGSTKQSLDWEYSSVKDSWKDLEAKDGTNGFSQSGYCQFIAPNDQKKVEHFGLFAYWIKVNCKDNDNAKSIVTPTFKGIYLNSIEAKEGKTIDRMLLGSSDGSGSQKFIVNDTPLFDLTLWVLEPSLPKGHDGYEDTLGDGYWVLWSQIERLGYASASQRVFTLDSFSGEVRFGDDTEGKIPILGKDNIVVSYRIGGGKRGNVLAGEVSKLVDTVAFVDKVKNPIAASGGADLQSMENLMEMAPKRIKHRYRAVSREDYTYMVREASSDIAKVAVVQEGKGKLDLYIVPFSKQRKPMPSLGLKKTVQTHIDCVSPATATVTAKEPVYVSLNLELELSLVNFSFVSTMKNSINAALKRFLHPIDGNHQGEGWEFGVLPSLADFYQLFDEIEGIEIIETLQVTLSSNKGNYALNDQSTPILSKKELICNGNHNITLNSEVQNEPCHT